MRRSTPTVTCNAICSAHIPVNGRAKGTDALVALQAPSLLRASATAGHRSGVRVADVDERVFGSFVEHMGRCVYGGIYEPRRQPRIRERRARAGARAGRHDRALPGRQLRLGLRLGGRHRPARRAAAAARARLALDRDQPGRHRRVPGAGRARPARSRCSRSTWARAGSTPRAASSSTATRPRGTEWADRAAGRGALRRARVVHRQRDGRAVADRPQGRRDLRQAGQRDRQGDAARRPVDRARRVRQLALADADVRRLGGHGARPRLGRRRPHLAAHVLRPGDASRRPRRSWPPRSTSTA